jgi:hypothetical protein
MISLPTPDNIEAPTPSSRPTPEPHSRLANIRLSTKVKLALLVLLSVAHFGLTFWYAAPGPLSVDEAIYHWMAKSFSDSARLDVWNGYEEFPSPELHHRYIRARGDKLFPQYPSLFAVLALPFYRVFGFFGLFVMNSFAFVGVVVLSFLTARKLFRDLDLALNSCLILILATFAWEYSQAAWPHAVGLLCLMGSFFLGIDAYYSPTRWRAMALAAASGAIGAIGLGMRLDGILVFPAVVLPFLFARPSRPVEALMVGVGAIPALLPLVAINYIKFGVLDPFSYGEGPGVQVVSPWPVVAAAFVVVCAWIATRPAFGQALTTHSRMAWIAAGVAALMGLLLLTPAGALVFRTVNDAYICIVDIRALPTEVVVAARSSGGGVLYLGAHKKALVQSMPYAVLLLVPLLKIAKPDKDFTALTSLFLTPLTVFAFYSYSFPFHDTGGLCLNTRYFLPCLPFVAILCAYALKELKEVSGIPRLLPWIVPICLAMAALFLLLIRKAGLTVNDVEFPLLALPLWMSALLLILLVLGQAKSYQWVRVTARAALVVAVGGMAWAGLVALGYDYPAHQFARAVHYFYGQTLLKTIPPDSILFADNKTFAASTGAIDKGRVRIAFPAQDHFKDFGRLLSFQLHAGRRAFALFQDRLWQSLKAKGIEKDYRVTPVVLFHGFTLSEISLASARRDQRTPDSHP